MRRERHVCNLPTNRADGRPEAGQGAPGFWGDVFAPLSRADPVAAMLPNARTRAQEDHPPTRLGPKATDGVRYVRRYNGIQIDKLAA